jgi:hypothetical protein
MKDPSDKPVKQLRRFAKQLGWPKLRVYQTRLNTPGNQAESILITWYESGEIGNPRTDCFLQINESPIGQTTCYEAAVYAIRYRICTGWHRFTLYEEENELLAEASRLENFLGRQWFATLPRRRTFRLLHPDCTGYSWQRVAVAGVPHRG